MKLSLLVVGIILVVIGLLVAIGILVISYDYQFSYLFKAICAIIGLIIYTIGGVMLYVDLVKDD